jgi:hypothetical protein
MKVESFSSPSSNLDNAFPHGTDQPAVTNPLLAQGLFNSGNDVLFQGTVTDVSSNNHSCTVTIPVKTAFYGVPCVYASTAINRWGGATDSNPPEVGSVVAVYMAANANYGVVIGQIPGLIGNPGTGLTMFATSAEINSFIKNTGQTWSDMGTGGSALNGHQKQPFDIFPGEKCYINELNLSFGLFRTMAFLKASELAKIEAFLTDDHLRIVGHLFDEWTCATERTVREDKGGILSIEYGEATNHAEAQGVGGVGFGLWRHKVISAALGDLQRDFVLIPGTKEEDSEEVARDVGLSEIYRDSAGLIVNRSVAGCSMSKVRSIGVPRRIRTTESTTGADEGIPAPNLEDLIDFEWEHDKPVDRTAQLRDAKAWVMGKQANAGTYAFQENTKDWQAADDSPEASGSMDPEAPGADTGVGGHNRERPEQINVGQFDKKGRTKSRTVTMGDAWVDVMPDGSICVRDIMGSTITMADGHITLAASKDINLIPGRNFNVKWGRDATIGAYRSIDITGSHGQCRIFSEKSSFIHSEKGGIMLSTNTVGFKGNVGVPSLQMPL